MTDEKSKPHKPVVENIARYLILWDPIGVTLDMAKEGLALSEYDGYAGPLYTLLASGAAIEDVQKYLEKCLGHMGMEPIEERDRPWAERLHKYFNESSGFRA